MLFMPKIQTWCEQALTEEVVKMMHVIIWLTLMGEEAVESPREILGSDGDVIEI